MWITNTVGVADGAGVGATGTGIGVGVIPFCASTDRTTARTRPAISLKFGLLQIVAGAGAGAGAGVGVALSIENLVQIGERNRNRTVVTVNCHYW